MSVLCGRTPSFFSLLSWKYRTSLSFEVKGSASLKSLNSLLEDLDAFRPPYLSDSPIFSGCVFIGDNEPKEKNRRCWSAKEWEQTDNSRLTHSGSMRTWRGCGCWLNAELIPLGLRIGGIGSFVRRKPNVEWEISDRLYEGNGVADGRKRIGCTV